MPIHTHHTSTCIPFSGIDLLIFFIFLIFDWRIIALEYCHRHTPCKSATSPRGSPPPAPPPRPSQPPPLGSHRAPGQAPCARAAPSRWLTVLPMAVYMSQCYPLSSSHPLTPPLCPMSVLYVCVSLPALQISSSVPLLGRYLESQLIYKGPVLLKVQHIESEIHMRAGRPAPPEVAKGPGDQMEAVLQDAGVYVYRLCVCTCRDFTLTFQIQETNPFSTTHLPTLVVADSINLLICVFHSKKF